MTNQSPSYEDLLLAGWEEVYRKSQLSLFMLLALKDGAKCTSEIKEFIQQVTNGLQATDEQSMYRALRRYHKAGMVTFREVDSKAGPSRKQYTLTPTGRLVLRNFLHRNITNIFYRPQLRSLITQEE